MEKPDEVQLREELPPPPAEINLDTEPLQLAEQPEEIIIMPNKPSQNKKNLKIDDQRNKVSGLALLTLKQGRDK